MRKITKKIMLNKELTNEEKLNIEFVKEWAKCWSISGLAERMVDEIYVDSCEVFTPLQDLYYAKRGKSKEKWRRIDIRADEAYKKHKMELITIVPKGNTVALEAKIKTVTVNNEVEDRWFAAFLTIENGRITIDHTYHRDPSPLTLLREYLSEIQK